MNSAFMPSMCGKRVVHAASTFGGLFFDAAEWLAFWLGLHSAEGFAIHEQGIIGFTL